MATRGFGTLELSQGSWAVEYAREVVESTVADEPGVPEPAAVDDVFEAERGVFVTLEKRGELRGCIGRPYPEQPALRAIREAASDAATQDPRFSPVSPSELESITVEVSLLTAPEVIDVGATEIPKRVQVGRDGLIVRRGERRGLLLPQVPVDQGWGTEEFLDQTSRKAGLPMGSWRDPDVNVERFTAEIFAETEPAGAVTQQPLAPSED